MINMATKEVPSNMSKSNSHGDSFLGLPIGVEAEVEATSFF